MKNKVKQAAEKAQKSCYTNKSVFNLLILTERPSSPYADLERYNISLTEHKKYKDDNHPVEVMRHHIIPASKLKKFWNKMVENNHLINTADGFLKSLINNIQQYKLNNIEEEVIELLDSIRYKKYEHDKMKISPQYFDDFIIVYEWMPGNLFIGPKGGGGNYQRTDDPGDSFETKAGTIIGEKNFEFLWQANSEIDMYLSNSQDNHAHQACIKLSIIAKKKQPYSLNPDNWLLKDKKYRIR